MYSPESIVVYVIIGINVILSIKAFSDYGFFTQYKFNVDGVLIDKQWLRILSSGFLHADYVHLAINMFVFYSFGETLCRVMGIPYFILLILGSLLAGNLFALFVHRNHGDYSAVGFSGATSGVVLAFVAIFPKSGLTFLFIPFLDIPAWIMGVGFMCYSLYGIVRQQDNIGHEAHVGGAVFGFALVLALFFDKLNPGNWPYIGAVLVPILAIMYVVFFRQDIILTRGGSGFNTRLRIEKAPKERLHETASQEEVDAILDKINEKGINSLNKREKEILKRVFK